MSTSDSHPDLVSKPLDERALAQIERNLDFGHGPSWALLAECRSLREQVETHKRERDFEVSSYARENEELRAQVSALQAESMAAQVAAKLADDTVARLRAERDEARRAWRVVDGNHALRAQAEARRALDRLLGGAE